MVKTRFAPSPTGFLHIGGVRTALFNYIFAKHFDGKFVLRIEDTDIERSLKEYEKDIIDSLDWLGLLSDEQVVYQSKRFDIYNSYYEKLIKEGKAYNCYCSSELLEEDRNRLISEGKKSMYTGRCRNLGPKDQDMDKPHVIRFKVERGVGFATGFKDLIRDQFVVVNNDEIDDFVIVRTDGISTYNFAVVIDDALTNITHIIRGDDHLSNTPKQVMLYNALGFTPPEFAHVSMILGNDGKRLSKRHGAASVNQYKKDGFLPEALLNYLVRLGWSHGNDEIFSLQDMIKHFNLKNISKSSAVFNNEKLLWLNSYYIKSKDAKTLINMINDIKDDFEPSLKADEKTISLVEALKSRSKTLREIKEKMAFYLNEDINYNKNALNVPASNTNINTYTNTKEQAEVKTENINKEIEFLNEFKGFLEELPEELSVNVIKDNFNLFLVSHNLTLKEKAMIIRVALTGETVSPGIYEVIFALGKDKCIKRINKFIDIVLSI